MKLYGEKMAARLIVAIVSTLIWEGTLVVVWRWGLPEFGIRLHVSALVVAMVVLAAYSVISFHIGSRALSKPALIGMASMVGSRGKAVSPLAPEGTVMIGSELWTARSVEGNIAQGEEAKVVGQEGLRLFVRKLDKSALNEL